MSRRLALLVSFLVVAPPATAQVIGTFRWQTQPFCNVLTLTVSQQGGQFLLTGTDDLCGAGVAPVTGTAVVNGASVAMGLTVALPSGAGAHLTASIALSSVSGPWQDADGRTGTFQFLTGAGTGGSPRPAPASAAVITSAQLAPTIFAGSGSATTLARSDHDHDATYAPRQVRVHKSGVEGRFLGVVSENTVNGCLTNTLTGGGTIQLGLDVPLGAALTQVSVLAFDGSDTSYSIEVKLVTAGATGMSASNVLTANGGAATVSVIRHTMTPITPIVLAAGQHFSLHFSLGGTAAFGSGLCAVEFAYTLPQAP